MPEGKKHRQNGEGTIFKRSDGLWQASFVASDGKRKYFYAKKKSQALEKMREAQDQDRKGILATGPRQMLGDYLLNWLETTHKPPMTRTSTYVQYRSTIKKHLVPSLGHIQLQNLTVQQVQNFYSQKLEDGASPSSISVMHAVLHSALENAVKWNLITRNVASLVTTPGRNPHEIKPLSTDEAKKLIEAAKESEIYALLLIAVTTGMRRGELLGLRWTDINLATGVLQIRRTLNRIAGFGFVENEPKTKKSKRRIKLPQVAVTALLAHRERQLEDQKRLGDKWQDKNLVFANTVGGFLNPTRLLKLFNQVLEKAGLAHMRFHDLRHSAATILLTMGVNGKVVQELLGHSTIAMTMDVYSHILPTMHDDAMNDMNDLFS